jgi:hypothetical protein
MGFLSDCKSIEFLGDLMIAEHKERLDRMIFFSEQSIQHAVSSYVVHNHQERNHRKL